MATLLVADASANIHRIVELTFSGQDIRVVAVNDGDQAIARLTTEPPDIVLADVALPTRSGYDVCAYIRQTPQLAHIPVLLLTGAFEPVDESRAPQTRWDGIVVKPFEPPHLAARVRELLAGRVGSRPDVVGGVPRPLERLRVRSSPAVLHAPASADADAAGGPPVANEDVSGHGAIHSESTPVNPALDEYFERLDSALSSRPAPSPAEPAGRTTTVEGGAAAEQAGEAERRGQEAANRADAEASSDAEVPTLDRILSSPSPADGVGPPPLSMPTRNPIADALTALMSSEMGEAGAQTTPAVPVAPEPVITEAVIDEITRRVVQRLSTDALDRVVAGVVREAAERLVREEIRRRS